MRNPKQKVQVMFGWAKRHLSKVGSGGPALETPPRLCSNALPTWTFSDPWVTMSLNSVENKVNGSGKTSKWTKEKDVHGGFLGSWLLMLPAQGIWTQKDDWSLLGFIPLNGHMNNVRTFLGCVAAPSCWDHHRRQQILKEWQIIQRTENHHAKWVEKGPKNDILRLPKYTAHIYRVNTKGSAPALGENTIFF